MAQPRSNTPTKPVHWLARNFPTATKDYETLKKRDYSLEELAAAMPPLWLKFAEHYAASGNATLAYQKSRPKVKYDTAGRRGFATKHYPIVRLYLEKIRQRQAGHSMQSLEEKREFLAKVARTPIAELDEDSPLVQEVTVNTQTRPDGSTIESKKVKMVSKADAIKIDNQMAGHNVPDTVGVAVNLGDVLERITSGDRYADRPAIEVESEGETTPALDERTGQSP